MALIEGPKPLTGINRFLNRFSVIGTRRVEKESALSRLKVKLISVLNEDGFTHETRFPGAGDDDPGTVERDMWVNLKGKDGKPYAVELFAQNYPERFFHLFVRGNGRKINIHEGTGTTTLPNGEKKVQYVGQVIFQTAQGGYLSHRESIDFMREIEEAEVDHEETERGFTHTQQRLSPISSIWWNRDVPGGAFTKIA